MKMKVSLEILEHLLRLNTIGCKIRGVDGGIGSSYGLAFDIYIQGNGLPEDFETKEGEWPKEGQIEFFKDEGGSVSINGITPFNI